MAALNGEIFHPDNGREASVQLGKRKRSKSPGETDLVNGHDATSLQKSLNTILLQSKKSDSLLTFLQHKIPEQTSDKPDAKRARLDSAEPEPQSIEDRILTGAYQSHDDVVKDVDSVRGARTTPTANGEIDGHRSPSAFTTSDDAANQLLRLLKSRTADESKGDTSERLAPKQHAGQIIMLRGTTDRGVSLLYSGLQSESSENKDLSKDARRLPNGFDLAEPATMDANMLAPTKQARKFGDVFGPHRNTKPLMMPQTRPIVRSNTLGFTKNLFPDPPAATPRDRTSDYKNTQLTRSSFLDYARGRALSEQDPSRKYRDKHTVASEFKHALMANDAALNVSEDPLAQFKKAFSSFAPEIDSSASAVSDHERYRQWWNQNGTARLHKIFKSPYPDPGDLEPTALGKRTDGDEFADVVNYVPVDGDDEPPVHEDPENIDDVLDEMSQLLETVHSYQRMRSLETRPSADTFKPSVNEFDTYEMLRSQLAILIASVPPFAVAKLDGDKLSDLNISANVMVEAVDYRGTLQPDDFTLSKYRAAQPPPRMPQTATPTARPTYSQPGTVPRYNAPNPNLQSYTHNLGVQAQVAQRQAQTQQYSTPQSLQRNYQPYSQQGTNYTSQQPNLQQFQRPVTAAANGYGNWNNPASNTPHTRVGQTPSQPGYQQRAQQQQAAMYAHTPSQTPSRPMPNGQMNYQNMPQYQRPIAGVQQGQQGVGQGGMVNGGQ